MNSLNTNGGIKGYVKHEDIINYIKEHWDKNVKYGIKEYEYVCEYDHQIGCIWKYGYRGFIKFKYKNEERRLYYNYGESIFFKDVNYKKLGLKDMKKSNTTFISLECWGSSVEIIMILLKAFGGGWIRENDYDKEYKKVDPD